MGEWNYVTNRDGINKVLRKRVQDNGKFENVYTLACVEFMMLSWRVT